MLLFNTLTSKKEQFEPLQDKKVTMYVCGPTVYDLAHLGHGRSAVSFDIIRKYFMYKGFSVTFVSNYTDIDDKMIKRAEERKITVPELAKEMISEYEKDYFALGIAPADSHPKATDYIDQMIDIIKVLEEKGHTYVLDDGVYFNVKTFSDYGKLSKQKLEDLESGARISVKESKRNPQDFVVWKFSKPGEPTWKSPWGDGRPGWHIECSAMSKELLGQPFDIHGGGLDLMFPHHECEIAQSESAFEKPLAKYWLHNGFITVNHEKMSKSLGNFFTLRDIFNKYPPKAVRFLFLQTHYRSPIEFSDVILDQAKNGLSRLHDFARRLKNYKPDETLETEESFTKLLRETREKFESGMENDFDTASALASWFDFLKETNRLMDHKLFSSRMKEEALNLMQVLDRVLGVLQPETADNIDQNILNLIQERENARKEKNWAKSDEIRNELLQKGIQLEDTSEGTVWKKV